MNARASLTGCAFGSGDNVFVVTATMEFNGRINVVGEWGITITSTDKKIRFLPWQSVESVTLTDDGIPAEHRK